MTAELNRRHALAGAAAVAVGVPLLAACGADSNTTATDPVTADGPLASPDDVPVGGCFVVAASRVVITQPTEGEFKAFSAICTHEGCTVSDSSDGVIPCKCHGSQFSLEDGSVLQGPATSALAAVQISVEGDSVSLA